MVERVGGWVSGWVNCVVSGEMNRFFWFVGG